MLADLQRQLHQTYRVPEQHDIRDFLITDRALAKVIGQDALLSGSQETLFFSESDDGLAMSLYLDADLLQRLEKANPLQELQARSLDDLWTVLEGLSHFTCLSFKAGCNREVSLLELELQAEVDKYVGSLFLALSQDDAGLLPNLHGWLFDDVGFHTDLNSDELDRYRAANDYASRFCHALEQPLLHHAVDALAELRHFFRLPIADKLSHIRSRSL